MSDPNLEVAQLAARYQQNRAEYRRHNSAYNEADVRAEYLDPLFALLGWDVSNQRGLTNRLREVLRETRVQVDERTKRPDYEFRLGAERKFFVEAKKPSLDILRDPAPAFQIRRYGWSAGLLAGVVTNFEDLVIYDTTTEPDAAQTVEHSRLHRFHYTEYATRWDEIAALLSRPAVYAGAFDQQFGNTTRNRPLEKIDAVFLAQLNQWRLALARALHESAKTLSEQDLNEITQRLILRILFLRLCEDRGIQTYEHLKAVAASNSWAAFADLLLASDRKYDSGLFETRTDPFLSGPQPLTLPPALLLDIIEALYYPAAPYTFSVLEPEFLGSIYEQFLTERLVVTGDSVTLARKPEHLNRDVISTPRPVIEKVVQEVLGAPLADATAAEILAYKILDPATGSGGFLIAAFDYLADALTRAYQRENRPYAVYETGNGPQLIFEEKVKLLTSCFYGVDRDYLAVEVARFSLLVKLLASETAHSLPRREPILPALHENIVFGDALVDAELPADPPALGVPLLWGLDLPRQYDFVIGNPPYLKTEDMVNLEPAEHQFYRRHYASSYRQFDKYFLFIERAVRLWLRPQGRLGMIVSRKFAHLEAGKKLRKLLSESAYRLQLLDFGNAQLFPGRDTYTCLLFLAPRGDEPPVTFPYALIASPQEWIASLTNNLAPLALPVTLIAGEKSWVLPNTSQELRLLEAMGERTVPLGAILEVFNGIQTSRNSVYVLSDATDSGTVVTFARDGHTWAVEKEVLKPFFDGKLGELKAFQPLPRTVPLLFPYHITAEAAGLRASVIRPDVLQTNYPGAWRWLDYNRATLSQRDIRPADFPADEWYRYGRDQALTVFAARPKIVVGVNSKGDKYVYDDTNAWLASGGTAGECAIAHFTEPARQSNYDLHFILALLNHRAVEYFCRKRGSPFRGGWYARGTAVLKEIPVPEINFTTPDARLASYTKIVRLCRELCHDHLALLTAAGSRAERLRRTVRQRKHEMDALISTLYGIQGVIDEVTLPA